ncbi:ribosome biogenesis protein SLX9-domain-containing protein [Lenzites betulinus]|nr:ribosome biogenesis protein SLX9-domain-containing protein [Lenzites betulinus]
MAVEEEPRPTMKKKEKQALKHELFIKRLEQSRSPYSKSHERRVKRKAKEQVAGGMGDMTAAIFAVEDAIPVAVQNTIAAGAEEPDATEEPQAQARAKPKPGQIGEGKGVPLSKNQRKRALQVERMRIPLILATPEFAANPFQTIRTHAQNTLIKHEPPSAAS